MIPNPAKPNRSILHSEFLDLTRFFWTSHPMGRPCGLSQRCNVHDHDDRTCALRWHLEHVESNICFQGCNYGAISQYALQLLALSPLLRPTFTFISTIFMRLILKVQSLKEFTLMSLHEHTHVLACRNMSQHVATVTWSVARPWGSDFTACSTRSFQVITW